MAHWPVSTELSRVSRSRAYSRGAVAPYRELSSVITRAEHRPALARSLYRPRATSCPSTFPDCAAARLPRAAACRPRANWRRSRRSPCHPQPRRHPRPSLGRRTAAGGQSARRLRAAGQQRRQVAARGERASRSSAGSCEGAFGPRQHGLTVILAPGAKLAAHAKRRHRELYAAFRHVLIPEGLHLVVRLALLPLLDRVLKRVLLPPDAVGGLAACHPTVLLGLS